MKPIIRNPAVTTRGLIKRVTHIVDICNPSFVNNWQNHGPGPYHSAYRPDINIQAGYDSLNPFLNPSHENPVAYKNHWSNWRSHLYPAHSRLIIVYTKLNENGTNPRAVDELTSTSVIYSASEYSLEYLDCALKFLSHQPKQETSMTSNDMNYLAAVLRPNITTSQQYTTAFLNDGVDIEMIYQELPERFVFPQDLIDNFKDSIQEQNSVTHPDTVVKFGREICKSIKGEILSVRFTAVREYQQVDGSTTGVELIAVLVYASQVYSLHYRNKSEIQYYLDNIIDSSREIKKVSRVMLKEANLTITPIDIDGRYQIHDEFYPGQSDIGGMRKVVSDFLTTTHANLMILAGQWGGGKSALFQAMAYEDTDPKNEYYLVDDPNVYANNTCLTSLIERITRDNKDGKTPVLLLEESDDFIRSKRENPFLSRIASLTSGAASLRLKVIICTNDTSPSGISPELLRAARLFAFLKFGLLSPDQANKARAAANLEPKEFDKDVSLSEALTKPPIISGIATAQSIRSGVGFTSGN